MKKKRLQLVIASAAAGVLALFVLLGFVSPWREERRQLMYNRLPEMAYEAIAADPALRIYTLDPEQPPANGRLFHGYRILHEVTCSSPSSREAIADDLRQRISAWRFTISSCFQPRHGIQAVHHGRRYDFVICFECDEMHFHTPEGSSSNHGFGETSSESPLILASEQ